MVLITIVLNHRYPVPRSFSVLDIALIIYYTSVPAGTEVK